MKIEYTNKPTQLFRDITKGTVFQYYGGIYMKIERMVDTYLGKVASAICLDSGLLKNIDDDATVTVVNCKLVIE